MHYIPRLAAPLVALMAAWNAHCAASADPPESQQEYWAQVDRRDWTAAVAAAEKLVAVARANEADEPLALCDALTMLGNAQLGAADYTSAEATYTEALSLAEKHAGSSSARLLDPLRGLGYSLALSGRHAAAVPFLDRSLIVGRRNYGLFEPGQQTVLRQLSVSLTKLGMPAEAERHMKYRVRVAEQEYGKGDPRIAPVLSSLGDWYADIGELGMAREQYRRALELVGRKLGKADLANVEPLRGLARTYTTELYLSTMGRPVAEKLLTADGKTSDNKPQDPRRLDPDGEKALERALAIVEAQPSAPPELRIATLVQLGDWRQIKHQPDEALQLYRRAAALLASAPPPQAKAASPPKDGPPALLSFPVRVYYPIPWLATRNLSAPAEAVTETFVQVEFTVTKAGDVVDARVVDKSGTSRQEAETLEAIRGARFRPRFVEGEPVDTTGLTSREVFRTRKDDSNRSSRSRESGDRAESTQSNRVAVSDGVQPARE
jgi:TonB family protein